MAMVHFHPYQASPITVQLAKLAGRTRRRRPTVKASLLGGRRPAPGHRGGRRGPGPGPPTFSSTTCRTSGWSVVSDAVPRRRRARRGLAVRGNGSYLRPGLRLASAPEGDPDRHPVGLVAGTPQRQVTIRHQMPLTVDMSVTGLSASLPPARGPLTAAPPHRAKGPSVDLPEPSPRTQLWDHQYTTDLRPGRGTGTICPR